MDTATAGLLRDRQDRRGGALDGYAETRLALIEGVPGEVNLR